MDKVRYFFALMLVLFMPPAVGLWYVIHPLARYWRRLGALCTYAVLLPPVFLGVYGIYVVRASLVGTDFGFSWVTTVLAVAALIAGGRIAVLRRRLLTQRILTGVPELSRSDPGVLLTSGIYGRIRHPRYVEIVFVVLGYALFSNHLGAYVVAVLSVPALYLVVLLEERELRDRFGHAYEAYSRSVPRFIPRRLR
ncbi:MAG: isoprenylcysteine carboxylmethyltransferase family protein [Acidobacteriota bacterium]